MNEPSWREVGLFTYSCFLILCVACLAMIFVFVSRECDTIFLTGGDCGIGVGWFGVAGGFFVIGMFSAYQVYRMVQGFDAWRP